ncbi:MTH938/NDUFAF3 family protein [Desulfobacula sp.]|uniref:MTH938/NDUFAF3 family protein n=1 Tax=Desulfobacula sp. TaxID=2593537 RepID=UPI002638C0CC|nr:MTH938/NDUFAF3 family protein [Desulfobacula sp.]
MNSMPSIDYYRFGKIIVNSESITSDLMILPNGHILKNWRRKKGHFLAYDDIQPIIDATPEVLIVGTGAFGLMKTDPNLIETLKAVTKNPLKLIQLRTGKAKEKYQKEIQGNKKIAACFHLTC